MGFSQNVFECRKNSHATFLVGMSPQQLNKCPRKFYLVSKKTRRPNSVFFTPKLKSLTAINELKIIIFALNYLRVLLYRRIPKINPGAYIFQRPFLRSLFLEGLIFGGAYLRREICISKSIELAL